MKRKLLSHLDRALSVALVISALAMVLIVLLQIIARFALSWSPHWTEEMARFCFLYMVSLGAGLALKDDAYVSVAIFLRRLPDKARLYMECVILLSICVLMISMFVSGFPLLEIVKLQTSAALQINMVFIYFSMILMSFLVTVYAFFQLIEKIRRI